jgi:hypothetical protein
MPGIVSGLTQPYREKRALKTRSSQVRLAMTLSREVRDDGASAGLDDNRHADDSRGQPHRALIWRGKMPMAGSGPAITKA